jgi:hypothetical protein
MQVTLTYLSSKRSCVNCTGDLRLCSILVRRFIGIRYADCVVSDNFSHWKWFEKNNNECPDRYVRVGCLLASGMNSVLNFE